MRRCSHCGQRAHTPRALQAVPLPSVHEATHRSSCLPSLMVGAFIAAIALLEGVVPAIVAALR